MHERLPSWGHKHKRLCAGKQHSRGLMGSNQTCFNFLFLKDYEAEVRGDLPQMDASRLEGRVSALVTEGKRVSDSL